MSSNLEILLTNEEVDNLKNEMIDFLKWLEYDVKEEAVLKIIETWATNKKDLILSFKRHERYNGNFQIVSNISFIESFKKEKSIKFKNYIEGLDFKVKEYNETRFNISLQDVVSRKDDINEMLIFMDKNTRVKTINGKTKEELKEEVKTLKSIEKEILFDDDVFVYKNKFYKSEDFVKIYLFDRLKQFLGELNSGGEIGEYWTKTFNTINSELRISSKQKISRVVNKILTFLEIDKLSPTYHKHFAEFSDNVNEKIVNNEVVFSIHPIDYLSSSFGNSWTTCHSTDYWNVRDQYSDSEYGSGSMSYLLDKSTIVFYTPEKEEKNKKYELRDKVNRQMFHVTRGLFIQSRLYPDLEKSEDQIKEIRKVAQNIFSSFWNLKDGEWKEFYDRKDIVEKIVKSNGTQYEDYYLQDGIIVNEFINDNNYN